MEISTVQKICIAALPLIFAITVHEVAHGWMASRFGDQTARFAGRLTLNPLKHIDLVGTIIVPFLMLVISPVIFGWAKPVPVDARNLKNPRVDMIYVALAGPLANIVMAILWGILARLAFNADLWWGRPLTAMGFAGIQINVVLAVLNLLPVPPLDGSRILYNVLPGRMAWRYYQIERYGFIILIFLMLTGLLNYVLNPPIEFLMRIIINLVGIGF